MLRNGLLLETIAIGVVAILFDLLIYRVVVGRFVDTKAPYFYQMILGAFLLGASIHVTFEFAGLNEKWCRANFK
jgi:hypothetical protein